MGCWNETDGLTQIPIHAGTRIKWIALLGDDTPWMLPLTGDYDDYGCIEEIDEDWHSELMMSQAKEFTYDCRSDHIPPANIKEFARCVERGHTINTSRTYFTDAPNIVLNFMMVDEVIYNRAIELAHEYPEHLYNGETLKEKTQKTKEEIMNNLDKLHGISTPRAFEYLFRVGESISWRSHLLSQFITRNTENTDLISTVLDDCLEFGIFISFMSHTRKRFTNQGGRGSQADAFEMHRGLMDCAKKVMADKEKEWEEC